MDFRERVLEKLGPTEKAASIINMHERVEKRKRAAKNADVKGICGFCKNMYRDDFGNLKCGIAALGEGHVIKKAFEEGCKQWQPRRDFQPKIFTDPAANRAFARNRKKIERELKGLPVNPF